MDEIERRDCSGCGAANPVEAQHCWQCYARFDASPAMAGAQAGAGVGLPSAPGPTRARPGFLPPALPMTQPTPIRRGTATMTHVLVGVLVTMVISFAISRLLGGGGGVDLPEQLDGQPRVHDARIDDLETQMRAEGDRYDLEIQAGLYGEPGFIVVVANGSARESSEELFDAFIDGVTRTGATVSEQELTGSFDGADYRCLTAEARSTSIGMCMWRADDHVGVVMGTDGDADSTQALTGRIYAELTR
jgi:hypothetical protein